MFKFFSKRKLNLTKLALTFILHFSNSQHFLYQFEYSDFEVKGQTGLQVYWFRFLPLFYIFHQLENYDPEVHGQICCSLKLQILISISTTRFYFVRHILSVSL